MTTIVLPWPAPELWPNRRNHWTKKRAAARDAKGEAYLLTPKEKLPDGDLLLELYFYPPDKRKRDLDNLVASQKAALDGMCEKLGVDDSRIRCLTVWMGEPGAGEVVMCLKALPEGKRENNEEPNFI